MDSARPQFGSIHFSTESLPPRDRMAIWREVYGRTVIRVDMRPLGETPFRLDADMHSFPRLALASITTTPLRGERTAELARIGNDDIGLLIPLNAESSVSQRDTSLTLGRHDAVLWRCNEVSAVHFSEVTRYLNVTIPRNVMSPLLSSREALSPTLIPADNPALRLLLDYFRVLELNDHLASDESRHAIATHIHDLVALMIGANRDAAVVAAGRGVRAARLQAIKADITANSGRREFSLNAVAARQGISPSYVRKLFSEEGTSFSAFVLDTRLTRAYRKLTDPRFAVHSISTIAFECGFGDLSYFNRVFRRRYHAPPSEVRALSLSK